MTSKSIYRCPWYSLLLILLFSPSISQQIPSVTLNSSVVGTTQNASIGLFTNFQSLDVRKPPIGLSGQLLFKLQIPSELSDTHITISTCYGSEFDTYLALLDGNPQIQQGVTALAEGGNDINCKAGRNKAFISTTLPPRLYFILVTGHADQQGIFNISVTAASATAAPIPWGLDRVDQRRLPLDGKYDVRPSGGRVWTYLIDSGVRTTHDEFEGRAQDGYDFVNNKEASTPDCTGHGTHVAGIIAGKTYGVSKQARIVSVRAFDCNNTARVSAIVDSLGWALLDARFKERRNVIIAMMFSTTTMRSSILQSAILGVQRSGIPVVVPAGNNGKDYCRSYLGSLGVFLTVGSTGRDDARSPFSNFGNCTKIYAPGDSIVSSWHNSDNSWRSFSGTAQAAAHITGVTSNLMHLNPMLKAEMIYNIIESVSTLDIVGNVADGESTRLAFVRSVPEFTGSTPPPEKEVYLFVILRFKVLACLEETQDNANIRQIFAEELGIKISRILLTCSAEKKAGSNADTSLIQLRFQLEERTAVAGFTVLENLLTLGKAFLEQKFGLPFEVVEEPWVVDSTLTVFWGAPTFSETESSSLSSGAIAGVVVGVLFLVSVIVMCTWLVYRRYAKLDVIESMEGSGDLVKQPETFKDFDNEGSSMNMRSFRNVIRRSMSFRKTEGGRKSAVEPVDEGLNRMSSYLGGPREKIGKDMVRVESFGGEAFAGFTSSLRKSSPQVIKDLEQKGKKPGHRASFRGANNLVIEPNASAKGGSFRSSDFDEADEKELDEALQMRSLGAEAFAMIGLHGKLNSAQSSRSETEEGTNRDATLLNLESYEQEALAKTEADRASDDGRFESGSSGSSSRTSSFFNL